MSSTSLDAAFPLPGKRDGILQPYVSEDVAKFYPAEHKDPDGLFASSSGHERHRIQHQSGKGPRTPEEFRRSARSAKWSGKMVKATSRLQRQRHERNVRRSCAIPAAARFLVKLAKPKIMQVQSPTDPPKKFALSERAMMVDGQRITNALGTKGRRQAGREIVPSGTEGTPMAVGPNAIFKNAPQSECCVGVAELNMSTAECQQLVINIDALRSSPSEAQRRSWDASSFREIKGQEGRPGWSRKGGRGKSAAR